jgi:broad specificity phosphatase PhoE
VKTLELVRHTDAEGDVLSPSGVRAAVEIGGRLAGTYDLLASSGAQRATQTLACILAGLGRRQPCGVTVDASLRSTREERWFEAARGGARDLEAFRTADPILVEEEAQTLGLGLRSLLDSLPPGGRGLAVGHSPMIEVAVWGLTGQVVPPVGKGEGVRIREDEGRYLVEPLRR